jgi:hypothetical protein
MERYIQPPLPPRLKQAEFALRIACLLALGGVSFSVALESLDLAMHPPSIRYQAGWAASLGQAGVWASACLGVLLFVIWMMLLVVYLLKHRERTFINHPTGG